MNYRLQSFITADKGQFVKDGQWNLEQSHQVDLLAQGNAIKTDHEQQALGLALQPKYVHMVTLDPDDLSPSQLISFMQYLKEYSQVPKPMSWLFGRKFHLRLP